MKPLVLGGGYLGSLIAARYGVIAHGSDALDITFADSVRALLEKERPSLIINTAAYTNTNEAEKPENREIVQAVNVQGPLHIAEAAGELGIPWVHFSTGMMFDGTRPDGDGWTESDTPIPTGYYAQTKAEADALLEPLAEKNRILILRIHTPLAAASHPRNFLNRLCKFDRAIDVPSSVTIVEDMLEAMDTLLQSQCYGICNAVNPGIISAFRITQLLQEAGLIGPEKNLTPLTREELDAMTKAGGGAHQTFPILSVKKLTDQGIRLEEAETATRRTIEALGLSA